MRKIPCNISEREFLIALGKEFAKIRKQKKLSQKMVLEDTGIHIGRIESQGRSPSLKTYIRLCEYLDVPFERILNNIYDSFPDESSCN